VTAGARLSATAVAPARSAEEESIAMTSMVLAASFWLALHFVIAGPLRIRLVALVGERHFVGLFSVLSIAGLVWFVFAYRAAPWVALWPTIPAPGYLALALVLLAFILVVFGSSRSNPTATQSYDRASDELPTRGITRVTRHPRLWGVSLWAVAHLLVNGHVAAVLMFGALLATALNGMVSIDRKRRHALGEVWDAFAARTSRLPFEAILAGRNRLVLGEFALWQLALGLALFAGVFWLHGVIGPSPLWALQM
jgi:uncharacterized membrane protein